MKKDTKARDWNCQKCAVMLAWPHLPYFWISFSIHCFQKQRQVQCDTHSLQEPCWLMGCLLILTCTKIWGVKQVDIHVLTSGTWVSDGIMTLSYPKQNKTMMPRKIKSSGQSWAGEQHSRWTFLLSLLCTILLLFEISSQSQHPTHNSLYQTPLLGEI